MTADPQSTSDLRAALSEFEARAEEAGLAGKVADKLLRRIRRHTDRLAAFRAERAEEAAEEAAAAARRLTPVAPGDSESKEDEEEEAAAAAAAALALARARADAAAETAARARREAWSARLWNDPVPSTASSVAQKSLPGAEADVDAFIAHMRREASMDNEERRGGGGLGDDDDGDDEREERAVWLALGKEGKKEEESSPLPLLPSSLQQ